RSTLTLHSSPTRRSSDLVFGQSHFFVEAVSPTPSPQPQANGEITEIARWSSEQANDIAWSHDGRTFAIATNKVWLHPVNEPNNRDRKSTRLNSSHVKISY